MKSETRQSLTDFIRGNEDDTRFRDRTASVAMGFCYIQACFEKIK